MDSFSAFFQTIGNAIVAANDFINGIVWGVPVLILLFGTGVFFTIRLGFIQFRRPGYLWKNTVIKAFKKKDTVTAPGELTSFQAAMVSVSAIVGSGNIAGVATAIISGGPGALIWMILAACVGMATKFAEVALGMKYRQVHPDGSVSGGAMYYLSEGLHARWLGVLFSVLVLPFAFVISPIVDSNTISSTIADKVGVNPMIIGAVLAVLTAIVIFGGIKRIGHVCEVISPFMGGAYIICGLLIIILNITQVPSAIALIVKSAFAPKAITGGAIGSVFIAIRYGFARGIYSNEAGLGTAAMIHCGAKVDEPIEQAIWAPIEVFLDTIVICTITALAIVLSGLWNNTAGLDGAVLTMHSFQETLGSVGGLVCLGCVILFGFSCIISYYTYAERAAEFIFGPKSKVVIKALWVVFVFVGSVTTLGFAWDLADTFNGLMIIPNLIGLILLSNEVVKMNKDYFDNQAAVK